MNDTSKIIIKAVARFSSFISNTSFTKNLVFWFLLFLLHISLSLCSSNFNWLGAYGALLTIYAVLLNLIKIQMPELKRDMNLPCRKGRHGQWEVVSNGMSDIVPEEYAIDKNQQAEKEFLSKYSTVSWYYFLLIIGTLLWAYSSLLFDS
jgi:hypothetical protein